ncbi:9939_t:CDS:1, partial [Funneliformis geosporum]
SGSCLGCEQEPSKRKVFGRYKKGFYYINYQSSPYEKEIKINVLLEMIFTMSDSITLNSYDDATTVTGMKHIMKEKHTMISQITVMYHTWICYIRMMTGDIIFWGDKL